MVRRNFFYYGKTITVFALFLIFILFGCDSDDGVSSEFATVSGTITFENTATWPDTGDVLVTIWGQDVWGAFGPTFAPAGNVTIQKVAGQNAYTYIFEDLVAGEYSGITVGWRFQTQFDSDACNSVTLGVYLANSGPVSTGLIIPGTPFQGPLPSAITLAKGDNQTGHNFNADWAIMQPYIDSLLNQFFDCGR